MRQFLMYGIVGAGGTVCHYLVLLVLVEFFSLNAVLASSFGFVIGALVNHELNRLFVFPGTRRNRQDTLTRFFLVACLGFLLNFGIMFFMVQGLGVYYVIAQLTATVTVFAMTFAVNKVWTFQA